MLRLIGSIVISVVILLALLLTACTIKTPSTAPTPNPSPVPAPESEKPAVIKDYTGRQWDVTHARDVYGMNPDYFNYGLGIGAIPSVDNPTVVEEGDPRYPESDSRTRVFGVNHNGEQRAYSVTALGRHEVFNDILPGESDRYVAVTY